MSTPWITLDCDIDAHAKMAALPSDNARYGWIRTLLEAKLQRPQGGFASSAHFAHVLGRHAKFLADYLRVGLMEQAGDRVNVHDWKRHQWASSKAMQRGTSEGQAEDKEGTFVGQSEDASRAVSVPVSVVLSEGVQGEPEAPALAWLASVGATVQPNGNGYHRDLLLLIERQGIDAVLGAMASRHAAGDRSARQLIYGAANELEQIHRPSSKPAAKGHQPDLSEIDRFMHHDGPIKDIRRQKVTP